MKILGILRKFVQYFINICFFILTFSTFIGVITRYVPGLRSALWTMEISRYSMIWIVFFASAVNIRDKDEIIIEFFISRVKGNYKKVLLIIGDVAVLFFLVILIVYGSQMAIANLSQFSPSLGLPMTYVYSAIPVGALLMLIEKIIVTVEHFKEEV